MLRFAECVAYERIQVARASRRHPELLEAIRRGELYRVRFTADQETWP